MRMARNVYDMFFVEAKNRRNALVEHMFVGQLAAQLAHVATLVVNRAIDIAIVLFGNLNFVMRQTLEEDKKKAHFIIIETVRKT